MAEKNCLSIGKGAACVFGACSQSHELGSWCSRLAEADQSIGKSVCIKQLELIRKKLQDSGRLSLWKHLGLKDPLGFNPRRVTVDIDIFFTRCLKSVASSNSDEDMVHLAGRRKGQL